MDDGENSRMIGTKNAYFAWHFFDVRSFKCAFLPNLLLPVISVAVLGACQHTTVGSEGTKAGSNMAALEVSNTIDDQSKRCIGC